MHLGKTKRNIVNDICCKTKKKCDLEKILLALLDLIEVELVVGMPKVEKTCLGRIKKREKSLIRIFFGVLRDPISRRSFLGGHTGLELGANFLAKFRYDPREYSNKRMSSRCS